MATQVPGKTYDVGGVLMERPFKIRRLGHFGINVVDMEKGKRFYRDLLGFRIVDVRDPLGGMSLVDEDFGWMALALSDAVRIPARRRTAWFLEGGYDLQALDASLGSTLRGALGMLPLAPWAPTVGLSPEHDSDLRRALASARQSWPTFGAE